MVTRGTPYFMETPIFQFSEFPLRLSPSESLKQKAPALPSIAPEIAVAFSWSSEPARRNQQSPISCKGAWYQCAALPVATWITWPHYPLIFFEGSYGMADWVRWFAYLKGWCSIAWLWQFTKGYIDQIYYLSLVVWCLMSCKLTVGHHKHMDCTHPRYPWNFNRVGSPEMLTILCPPFKGWIQNQTD